MTLNEFCEWKKPVEAKRIIIDALDEMNQKDAVRLIGLLGDIIQGGL